MGCAAELLSRCALQSNSRRESEHEVWSLYGDQTQPMPCAPRRWQKGVGQPNFQQPAGIVLFEIAFEFFGLWRALSAREQLFI